jgi:predicted metal-dependent phosphotriesterase family hydrolase
MRERGFGEEDIDRLLVHNPAAVLTMAEPQAGR